MKKHLYLTGALVLLLVLVGSATLVAADQPAARSAAQAAGTLEGPRWVLVSYMGENGKVAQVLPGAEATAQFEKGEVYGSTGCNTYRAPYEAQDGKLTVGLTATTMKMCPPPIMDQEAAYLKNIQAAASYKITDGTLTIADAKGVTVLTYMAEIPISLTDGTWLMTSYNNGKGGVVSALADVEVTAIFGEDGRLSGSAGCNTYGASYEVDGNKIAIGMGMSTMMMCLEQEIMAQEAAYLAALPTAATFKIEGSKLELRDATGALVASYTHQPATPLVGPTWLLTSYNNGKGGVVSALADTEVTAVFGADGTLSGSAGCNRYSAPYEVDGNKIKIGLAISTMMACPEPIMTQEQAYLAALPQAATFNIQGTRLELRDATGALLASYSPQPAGASALVGPTWLMTAYNNGKQAVVSGVDGSEVTAVFGADGQLSGSAGCNTYNAPYTVDGEKITIGAPATTRMMCPQPIMEQEAQYLAAIQLAATYNVQGSRLDLRSAEDALQATYTQQPAAEAKPAAETKPAAAPVTAEQDAQGTYLTLRPAASGGLTTLALKLGADGAAELTSSYTDQTPIVQTGAWQDNGDDTLTVTLTDVDGKKMAKPTVVKFEREGTFLNAVEYDKAVFGAEGLKLNLAADVARKVGPALVTIDLAAGFPLDPTFVSVNGGGEVDASLLGQDCKGFINRNPVATVNWTGDTDLLRAFFYSDSDSTLVVLTPDGKLVCNDNANEQLLDPVVEIKDPAPGKYRIWVGTAANRQRIPGILVLTTKPELNLDTFELAKLVRRPTIPVTLAKPAPQVAAEAVKKELEAAVLTAPVLKPGAPLTANVTAAGDVPLFQFPLTKTCGGLVAAKPSFVFKVAGTPTQVNVLFEGDADATLLVIGNDLKTVECNDDAEAGANINPLVTLANPAEGVYAVYVGRLDPTKPVTGKLTVTDDAEAKPAVLAPVKK